MHCRNILTMITIPLTLYAGSAASDEAANKMVKDALPLMHHTCTTAVDIADGDEAYIEDIVRKMTALVLINRNIDLTEYAETDEQRTKIREDFIEALRAGCENDKDALLGGVVDASVKSTLGL